MLNQIFLSPTRPPSFNENMEIDTGFFLHGFQQADVSNTSFITWNERRKAFDAQLLTPADPVGLLRQAWSNDEALSKFQASNTEHLVQYLEFYQVPAHQTIIQQGELGDYMVFVLSGQIRVNRVQESGRSVHLAQVQAGGILGEMSLFDSSPRFSSCISATECVLAVLKADTLDAMMELDASTAANLLALFARKLSAKLRQISERIDPG